MANATARLIATPITGALGARVQGADLRGPLSADLVDEIHALVDEHLVLFFPEQGIDDDQQFQFALRFGGPYVHPLGRAAGRTTAGAERIVDTVETPPFQDHWHTDVSWDVEPPTYGTLRAIEMPAKGGDTLWANAYLAYETLSVDVQERIADLDARHDMGFGAAFISKAGIEAVERTRAMFPGAVHPVVGVHPRTGRRYLNVNTSFTREIVGMDGDESAELLRTLFDQFVNPNLQVRWRWTVGDVVLWDEYATQHFAVADFMPARREMARVPVSPRG